MVPNLGLKARADSLVPAKDAESEEKPEDDRKDREEREYHPWKRDTLKCALECYDDGARR